MLVMDLHYTLIILLSCIGDELIYLLLSSTLTIVRRGLGIKILYILLISMFINQVLKYSLNVQRPPTLSNRIDKLPQIIGYLVEGEGPSLPSGHTQISTTFWTSLALSTYSKVVVVAMVSLPILIAYSRVALGMHSPLDVVAALIIGYSLPLIIYLTEMKFSKYGGNYRSHVDLLLMTLIFLSSTVLSYPKLQSISGLIASVLVTRYMTTGLEVGISKRIKTAIISLTTLGLGYFLIRFTPSIAVNEFIISLATGLIAYLVIPVTVGVFKLRKLSSL
ncbi:MAG: phosphatase PAP2 family protein [Sulfolobales archaeon]|nr:phosphatase PAP2 family protein [Sulfolobales archaeon]